MKGWVLCGGAEKEGYRERNGVTEDVEEGLMAPMELSDKVMEQIEAMAKELRKISGAIWALIEGVRKLTEVVKERR
jgi:hypothetical protein